MCDVGGKYNSLINEAADNKGFFSESSSVHVMYLSDKKIPVPEFLEACQIFSECHGKTKRNSASKDVFTEIAKCTVTFLNQMSDNGLMNRPNLNDFAYPSKKFPGVITKAKELPSNLNWQTNKEQIANVLPLTPVLYSEECENYCQSPFDKDNCDKLMNKFKVSSVSNESGGDVVSVGPPFVISFKTMSIDAGKGKTNVPLLKW